MIQLGRKDVFFGSYGGKTHDVTEMRYFDLVVPAQEKLGELMRKYPDYKSIPRKELGTIRRELTEALIEFTGPKKPDDEFYRGREFPVSALNEQVNFFLLNVLHW